MWGGFSNPPRNDTPLIRLRHLLPVRGEKGNKACAARARTPSPRAAAGRGCRRRVRGCHLLEWHPPERELRASAIDLSGSVPRFARYRRGTDSATAPGWPAATAPDV